MPSSRPDTSWIFGPRYTNPARVEPTMTYNVTQAEQDMFRWIPNNLKRRAVYMTTPLNEGLDTAMNALVRFLTSAPGSGGSHFYQYAYGDETKKALYWCPGGREGEEGTGARRPGTAHFFGVAPGAYPAGHKEKHQHLCSDFWLGWAGIDIDLKPGRCVASLAGPLSKLIPFSNLRSSCSGNGIHVITMLRPIKVPVAHRSAYIKAINAPIVERILQSGIIAREEICKTDYRIFWLAGGKNRWLYETPEKLNVSVETLAARITEKGDWSRRIETSTETAEPSERLRHILDLLRGQGVELHAGRNQINIGCAWRALEPTEWKFNTRSASRQRNDPPSYRNGFIDYIPGRRITIFANADGRVVREFSTPEEMRSRIGG